MHKWVQFSRKYFSLSFILLSGFLFFASILSGSEAFGQNSSTPIRPIAASNQPASTSINPNLSPMLTPPAPAPNSSSASQADTPTFPAGLDPDKMMSPGGMVSTLKLMLMLTVLSLAPAIMVMTTCFVRIIVVLGLLRQALGTQQLPPNQVLVSLTLFLTMMVMWPVWQDAYTQGIEPYTSSRYQSVEEQRDALQTAMNETLVPIRRFMFDQISRTGNDDAVWLFMEYQKPAAESELSQEDAELDPVGLDDIPTTVLIPAFMLSELKTAFVIGFQIYLPFIIIDMVISSVLISMGMMMLPPVLISLPFKLLLFVLIDGWYLTVEMLLDSIARYG